LLLKTGRDEFARHGLTQIQLSHRNVCKDGFGLQDSVDAVFLDLPAPWEAIAFAKEAMKVRHSCLCQTST
jgi:tRNA (adenine57-N1/adenine58-N1)-methyltransferase